ncbi:MAG: sigma-70 family RNA polymerase sigma factor [Candidatus Dormibacteraeota bacterium]|nr:sigma-70 family RNA polymerase sigma factor [Candidatus Dormibacteraeota bacterium]
MDVESLEALSDGELARRLSTAEAEDAFTVLYHRYAGRIFDFVARTVHDLAAAEDITQAAFIQAWQRRETLQDPDAVKAWLFRVAGNRALNHVTRKRATTDIDEQAAMLASSDAGPEEQALSREAARLVWDAAASLEPRQHAVLELAVRQQLTSAEIAQVMSLEPAHASVLVHRARDALGNAVRYLLVARRRTHCDRLAELVPGGVAQLTPEQRATVDRHMRRCGTCQEMALRVTEPEELLGALVLLPLPERLQTPPHLLMRPTSARLTETASENVAGSTRRVESAPVMPHPTPAGRRRRRAAVVALLLGVLVAGAGGSLVYVLSHPKAAGDTVATVVTPGGGQPVASNQQVTPAPLFGTPPPDGSAPPTPAPTAAPTQPPTATPGPTLPPLAVTAISICFVDARGSCDPGTTVQGCAPIGTAPGDVCKYELTFEVAAGAGGTIDWSLSGTASYCVLGTPAALSKSFGPSTGSVSVPIRPSDASVTTPQQSLSLDVNPASHTLSTATVTSPEGGSNSGSTGFYGTGTC